MSDQTIAAIKAHLNNRDHPDQSKGIDSIHNMEMTKGKRAKRVVDMKRTNQDYYRTRVIQKELLNHYENVDWWERDGA